MKKAKFWMFQIAMVAIVSLAFGSPVFAGHPDHVNLPDAVDARDGAGLSDNVGVADQHADDDATGFGTDDPGPLPDYFEATDTNGDGIITNDDCPDTHHLFLGNCVIND